MSGGPASLPVASLGGILRGRCPSGRLSPPAAGRMGRCWAPGFGPVSEASAIPKPRIREATGLRLAPSSREGQWRSGGARATGIRSSRPLPGHRMEEVMNGG